ncbi:MAG TPA: hypothetical protein DCL73_16270 [Treponema sp.]|nr:hypothetical protein [Treponema sp.]
MTIYFYTRQRKVCRRIAYILEENNNVCCIYTEENEFYTAVMNMKKYPDLLLLDYLVYNHDAFNVYRFMNDIDCKIPLLFYNDPLPVPEARVRHWNMMLNLYYSDADIDTARYTPTLQLLSDAVGSKELCPYISLLQPPLPYQECADAGNQLSRSGQVSQGERILLMKNNLPCSLYAVFRILYTHREKSVSITELQFLLHQKNIEVKINTIYSEISRLRTFLSTSADTGMDICRTSRGYRLFINDEN